MKRNSNGYPHVFGDKKSNGTTGNTVRRNRKSEIRDGGLQSGNTHISTCKHDSNEIPTPTPMFSGARYPNGTIGNTVRRNRKSEIHDGGLQSGNAYISTCRHDSNNILTTIFSLIAAKWLMPPKICKLCTGKARKPYTEHSVGFHTSMRNVRLLYGFPGGLTFMVDEVVVRLTVPR